MSMHRNQVLICSPLSVETCWKRVAAAEQVGAADKIVGYALASQMRVVASGDQFELQHTTGPAVFTGSISENGASSAISGVIAVPARRFYAAVLVLSVLIGCLVIGASAYDLVAGTHYLHTRRGSELGPGHPAPFDAHIAVFLLVPLFIAPVIVTFGPKIGGISDETRQTTTDFLCALFNVSRTD